MHPIIGTVLALFNAFIGFAIAVMQIRCFMQLAQPWRWVKLAYALVGIYWGIIYVYILFAANGPHDEFGQLYIRPAITLTLAMMMTGAIVRSRSGRGCE